MRTGKFVFWTALSLGALGLLWGAPAPAKSKKAQPKSAAKASPATPANRLESVDVEDSGPFVKVILQAERAIDVKSLFQETPPRLTLYFSQPLLSKKPLQEKISNDLLEEIRYGYKDGVAPQGTAALLESVAFVLKEPAEFTLSKKDWILVVDLRPRKGKSTEETTALPPPPDDVSLPLALPPRRKKSKAVLPPNPSLTDFLDVGFANHGPLRLAKQEYTLTKWRLFEASRALFPTVTGRYTYSKGTLFQDPTDAGDNLLFERKEIGIQLGQPLFHSGRLAYGVRQAYLQKRVTYQNLQKMKTDLAYEVKRAYYNLIKAQKSLKARRQAETEAKRILHFARKKRQLELITGAEALSAESQYSQTLYRLLSEEKDLELARLRLMSLLDLDPPFPEVLPEPFEPFDTKNPPELKVGPQRLLDQALRERPDVASAYDNARLHDYGYRVARAEGRLRVDLGGFMGKSGGAYINTSSSSVSALESLNLRSNWNIGIEARLYFLGHTARASGTKEKLSPDLGETSGSQTRAQNLSVGFLDGLKAIADTQQAKIARDRAELDREEALRRVELEVKEGVYNVERARLQLKGAQQEMDYRLRESNIARQKEKMNMIDPSQSIAAESAYAEAVSSFEEAVAYAKVSLAALEKAVGMPLETILALR